MLVFILAENSLDGDRLLDSVRVAGSHGAVFSDWRRMLDEFAERPCDAMIVELAALEVEFEQFLAAKSVEPLQTIPLILVTFPDGSGPGLSVGRRDLVAAWLKYPPNVHDVGKALANLLDRKSGYV